MLSQLLLRRMYRFGSPGIALTSAQVSAIDGFRKKCDEGVYQQIEVPCLCGNKTNRKLVGMRDRHNIPVNTWLCLDCAMLWSSPRLDSASLLKFYNDDYHRIYEWKQVTRDLFFTNQVNNGRRIESFVSKQIRLKPGAVVFDVGCGAGGSLVPFKEKGWNVYGCDFDKTYLQWGKEEGLTLEHGGLGALKKHGPADLIILNHVLEHCADPRAVLDEIHGSLRDGGYAFIGVPGVRWIHHSYNDILGFLQNAHIYHFTLATLSHLAEEAGFSLVEGEEHVRAVFQKTSKKTKNLGKPPLPNEAPSKIMRYLYFCETYRVLQVRRLKEALRRVLKRH